MDQSLVEAVERILKPFIDESLPEGGINAAKSLWQRPGRGSAAGSDLFPGKVDVRYLRFLVEALYRIAELTGNTIYHSVADAHVRFMMQSVHENHPTWMLGNALEMIGLYHLHNLRDKSLVEVGKRIVDWGRRRKATIVTEDGVSFEHFLCGYGFPYAKDAGWTNDLSMFGAGLVWAYEVIGDESILADAVSFSEYFIQPWRPNALGSDGYWHCGTWREELGSWVIGPAHFTGFESTDVYADENSWVFSTITCIDYLTRLHRHSPDPRFLNRCVKATDWTFRQCQFEDGGVGMCRRDDKWLGFTGDAITQVALLKPFIGDQPFKFQPLLDGAKRCFVYLRKRLPSVKIEEHGVEWVTRTTSTDPLVNVAMLWVSAVLGWLNGLELGVAQ